MKALHEWSVEDYAQHYVSTINSQPNGCGQHVSDIFGQSHNIMWAASKLFGHEATHAAIENLLKGSDQ